VTKLNWQIVDRYFAGEATAAECALVERWLAESAALRRVVAELYRGALDDEATHQAAVDVRARLDRDMALARGPGQHSAPRESIRALPSRGVGGLGLLKVAAAIAVLLGGSLAVWQTIRTTDAHHSETALRTLTAPAGQRVPVSLPDGSQVILSPGSTLRYAAATFGTTARREVHLEGEAYFDVDHDARRPFVVRAGDLVAEDLGTEFVVRAYPEDEYGRVIVREGLVGLGGTVVAPGELGRRGPNGAAIVEPADTASWFAWTAVWSSPVCRSAKRCRSSVDGTMCNSDWPTLRSETPTWPAISLRTSAMRHSTRSKSRSGYS
jgi:ferric-dicitrate binding protein FerR (iron transport regulator)